jgi:hypothetical protein
VFENAIGETSQVTADLMTCKEFNNKMIEITF